MAKSNLRLVPPLTEKRTVGGMEPPRRPPNRELREREHLTDAEVERLIEAARDNRHGYRDALMILMAWAPAAGNVGMCSQLVSRRGWSIGDTCLITLQK
jgi:hypothetical protein